MIYFFKVSFFLKNRNEEKKRIIEKKEEKDERKERDERDERDNTFVVGVRAEGKDAVREGRGAG